MAAPYEADGQMAYLVRHGFVDAVITEDSDLLAYDCPAVLYKLDANGYGRLARFADLQWAEAAGSRLFDGAWPDEWRAWEDGLFLDMCILAGTDHMRGVPGVGLKTAHSLLRRHRSLEACLPHVLPAGAPPMGAERSELLDTLRANVLRVREVSRA